MSTPNLARKLATALYDKAYDDAAAENSYNACGCDEWLAVVERLESLATQVEELQAQLETVGAGGVQRLVAPTVESTVTLLGVRPDGSAVNLGQIAMPPKMKAREIVQNYIGSPGDPDDDFDYSEATTALRCCLDMVAYMKGTK